MRGFYLLKPDMLCDSDAFNFYLDYINNSKIITAKNFYVIDDWIKLSKLLYEPDIDNMSLVELRKLRKQMLVTIKGYDLFYKNKEAIFSEIDIHDLSRLQELFDFKKELRKRFVYGENKNYISFKSDIDFDKRLIDIDLDMIECETLTVGASENVIDNDYNMIFFNKIHFPDPNVGAINRDLGCIDDCNIVRDSNLIKILK